MVNRIPTYSGFSCADVYTASLIDHIQELTTDTIREILKIYNRNNQCVNRSRHNSDIKIIKKTLEERSEPKDD